MFERDILMVFAGISLLAFIYWSSMYLHARKRIFFVLALLPAVELAYYLNELILGLQFERIGGIIFAFLIFLYCLLAYELKGFKENFTPRILRLYRQSYYGGVTIQIASQILFSTDTALKITHGIAIALCFVVAALFAILWLGKGVITGRFAFFAYMPKMWGYILSAFSQMGILPAKYEIAGPIGTSIFLLLLLYGMVTYMVALRAKRQKEQKEKEDLIRGQNVLLEKKVEERTIELEQERKRSEELLIRATQKQMTELQLQSLRAQLNPHFMFNSLNSIQEFILKEDNEHAHTYLARFAKLLRMLLEHTESSFISLQKEIDFLELYLSLEKLRLPNLEVSITIDPSIDKANTLIPNMILQPYIENALWHGLSYKSGDRVLTISMYRQKGAVVYEIQDNGVGRKKSEELRSQYRKTHKSYGNELLAKRFKLLNEEFGSDIRTRIKDLTIDGQPAGTRVSIIVPDALTRKLKTEVYDTSNHY